MGSDSYRSFSSHFFVNTWDFGIIVTHTFHLTNDLTVERGLAGVFGRRFSDDDDGNADGDALSRLPSRVAR